MTEILTWLYTSKFTSPKTAAEINALAKGFAEKNEKNALTGFMISNGVAIMQLLEGPRENLTGVKDAILADSRHTDIHPEIFDVSPARVYPNWAMRCIDASNYGSLFEEIERAEIQTLAIKIAAMLFDFTFNEES